MQISRTQNQPNFRSRGPQIKFHNPDEIAHYMPQNGYLSLAKQTAILKDLTDDQNVIFGMHFDIRSSLPITLSCEKKGLPRVNRPTSSGLLIHTISEEARKLLQISKTEERAPILHPLPKDSALSRLYKRILLGAMEKQNGIKVHNRNEMGDNLTAGAMRRLWRQVREIGNIKAPENTFEIGYTPFRIAPFSVACETKASSRAQKQYLMNVDIAQTAKALKQESFDHSESPVVFPRLKLTPSQIEGNHQLLETLENL